MPGVRLTEKFLGNGKYYSDNKIVFDDVTINQTLVLAKLFAKFLRASDPVLLSGEIGSGKTFFSRGVIQEMMNSQGILISEVPSPTFTIVQPYDSLSPSVWHLDLYRLSDPDEIIDLDLEAILKTGICLIEWPSKMGLHVPKRNILISFDYVEKHYDKRKIYIEFSGADWMHISKEIIKK